MLQNRKEYDFSENVWRRDTCIATSRRKERGQVGVTFKKGIIMANAIASMRIHGWNEGCCGRGLVSAHRLVCVATSRPASTTNPITRLCSPWPPLHSRLCLFIHPDLSEPPNFTNFAFLSQTPEIRSVHRFEAARFVSKTPNYNGEGLDQKDFD